MTDNRKKYLWFALILLLLFFWSEREELYNFFESSRRPEYLDFNRPKGSSEPRAIVVSSDEKIHMDVFERVHPAVVNIATTTLIMNFWLEVIPRQGQGSGFIIDREGYILTNNHVVAKAQKITVTMADGSKIAATLIGRDQSSDLAVIKIPSRYVNVVAPLADSDKVRVGTEGDRHWKPLRSIPYPYHRNCQCPQKGYQDRRRQSD
ncbi:MAG: trypsin-like peptidase domain-containing protein [Pseudomonadota bacterium]